VIEAATQRGGSVWVSVPEFLRNSLSVSFSEELGSRKELNPVSFHAIPQTPNSVGKSV
jgi:hypothetical protein